MRFSVSFFTLFASLLFLVPAYAAIQNGEVELNNPAQVIHLTGQWRFQPADSPDFSQRRTNDAQWPRIPVQNEWRMHGFDYEGNAWYRLHFRLGKVMQGTDLGLMLPPIASASFVYCNDQLIGGRGAVDSSGNLSRPSVQSSFYFIPSGILKPGEDNVIAIRMLSYHSAGGIFGNDWIYLGPARQTHEKFLTLVLLTVSMAAAFIIMAIYHVILLYARNAREYFYFALISFAMGLHLLGMNGVSGWISENFTVSQLFMHSPVGFFPFAMAGYLREHYDLPKSVTLRLLTFAGIAFILLISATFLFINPLIKFYLRYALPVGVLFVVASIVAIIVYTIRGWRRTPAAKVLILGFGLFSLAVTNDMLQYFSLPIQVKLGHIGFLAVVLAMAAAMAVKIQQVFRDKEEAQTEAVRILQRADKLKDDFLANTSHELRTPLFGIIGLTESLLKKSGYSATDRENLELIMMSSNRLARLVDDILDMSKLKNHAISLAQKPVDLHEAIDVAYRILQPMIGSKAIFLQNIIPADFPYIYADENRLQQILHNLIGNGIKFTTEGYVRLMAEHKENTAIISVADTGIGISRDKFETIFNAFEQLEDSLEREHGGTGLGLSITRQLVELHGGTISVSSEAGAGSVFSFSMPLAGKLTGETNAQPPTPAVSERKKLTIAEILPSINGGHPEGLQVMIADDEPVNVRLILQVLEEIGIKAHTAHDGNSALEIMEKQEKWDLVLLDVMMPGMNGFRVCEKIRERWPATELPIIFLTARGSSTDLVKGFSLGANDYLPKPVGREEIIARIQTQLSLSKARVDQLQLNDIRKELELAQRIQRASLPERLPESPFWDLAVDFEPMALIGGDFYAFMPVDSKRLGVFVADVSGHGIPASLIASMLGILFHLQQSVAHEPTKLLGNINSMVYQHLEGNFVTSCYLYIDIEAGKILTANGGHPPLIKVSRKNGGVELLKPTGRVHGINPLVEYHLKEAAISSGDRIVLYSDGIVEAGGTEAEMYGQERFLDFIQSHLALNPQGFADALRRDIQEFTGRPANFGDDFTLIVLDIR